MHLSEAKQKEIAGMIEKALEANSKSGVPVKCDVLFRDLDLCDLHEFRMLFGKVSELRLKAAEAAKAPAGGEKKGGKSE